MLTVQHQKARPTRHRRTIGLVERFNGRAKREVQSIVSSGYRGLEKPLKGFDPAYCDEVVLSRLAAEPKLPTGARGQPIHTPSSRLFGSLLPPRRSRIRGLSSGIRKCARFAVTFMPSGDAPSFFVGNRIRFALQWAFIRHGRLRSRIETPRCRDLNKEVEHGSYACRQMAACGINR